MLHTCAVTGHRPARFHWRGGEADPAALLLKARLRQELARLAALGVRRFYLGGALGADLWAGEALAALRAQPGAPAMELCLALPFPGYADEWTPAERARLDALKAVCDREEVIGREGDPAGAYRRRNQYMVDRADILLAVCDPARPGRSGTQMTVNYARKKGIPILFIHPVTAAVTEEPGPPEAHI